MSNVDAVFLHYGHNQPRVRTDVAAVTKIFLSLRAVDDTFVSNDGQSHLLISLIGTIPIQYRGATYNIPLQIWLLQSYPLSPPIAYVRPTQDMAVRPKHKNVDASGLCYLPYLSSWKAATCDLIGLILALQQIFSLEPPVYAKPTRVVSTPPMSYPQPSSGPTSGGFNQHHFNSSPTPMATHPTTSNKDLLNSKLHTSASQLSASIQNDIGQFQLVQQRLKDGGDILRQSLEQLKKDKPYLEQTLISVSMKDQEISQWLEDRSKEQISVDDTFVPADVLSQQMFNLVAEDATIEDTIYELDKALYAGHVDSEAYLKLVRSLSREQFHIRALALKIYNMQTQQL
eukprot:TRINITY_DN4651_c0_g1_i1.p1 TRINITY_DN4651_c0_g1~~TRINITY_DN4651_c0_g1_i1.p1  ORF type:complete len:343 (+),score=59.82 TRINITY_DN4651_c0_g1_i1:54-1082(+)